MHTIEKIIENIDLLFLFVGLPAQFLFFSRFIVQWIVSEKHGKSVMPTVFWHLSIGGSIGLFIYGLLRGEPILILGQALACCIYIRNLVLIGREKRLIIQNNQQNENQSP